MSELTIYAIPISLYCAKVRVVLRHKKLDWQELPPPGGYKTDEYKQVVPSGNLPTLIDGDLMIADSEAINEYLNEKYPEPPLLPGDFAARAKMRELSRFHDTRLEPEFRKLFPYLAPENRDPEVNQRQSREFSIRLAQLAKMLRQTPFNGGERLTLGNAAYCFTFAWIDALTPVLDMKIDWPDEVINFRRKLETDPSVAVELAAYGPKLKDWLVQIGAL